MSFLQQLVLIDEWLEAVAAKRRQDAEESLTEIADSATVQA
jgi:hypothetical protein